MVVLAAADAEARKIPFGPQYRIYLGGEPGAAGKGWNGWMDEIRYSNQPLESDQFLRASDNPKAPPKPAPKATDAPQ